MIRLRTDATGRLGLAIVPAAALLLIGAAGCTSDGYPLDNTYHYQGKAPSSAPPPSTFRYRYPDVAPVLDAEGLQRLVSQYRHHVVLLDFWASWNQRNREEMQMLSRLQEDLADEGFQVIACSFDPPEKWGNVIVPMLHGGGANFPCVVVPEANRAAIRQWLCPQWTYDVPARFVISRTGKVASFGFSDMPLSTIEQQTRDLVRHGLMVPSGPPGAAAAAVPRPPDRTSGLRAKIINVNTGSYESIAEVTAEPGDLRKLADQMAVEIARRIDRGETPRIGVLPFPSAMGRREADAEGVEAAEQIVESLRREGFYDFVRPPQVQRLVQQAGLTPTSIEYDPASAKGKMECNYLIVGWLRDVSSAGERPVQQARRSSVVNRPTPSDDRSAGEPGDIDAGMIDGGTVNAGTNGRADREPALEPMEPVRRASSRDAAQPKRSPHRGDDEFEEDLP